MKNDCLYCKNDEGMLLLSREINAYVHEKCLKKELLKTKQTESLLNQESIIIGREFGLCQ